MNNTTTAYDATLDDTLNFWQKMQGGGQLPRWLFDGEGVVERISELTQDTVNSQLKEVTKFVEEGGSVSLSVFLFQLQGAYTALQFLRSRGIDPAIL